LVALQRTTFPESSARGLNVSTDVVVSPTVEDVCNEAILAHFSDLLSI
jgi:hypothetical protein